jgi:Tfp pilus assembly protein PilF
MGLVKLRLSSCNWSEKTKSFRPQKLSYNSDPHREGELKRWTGLVIAVFLFASGCTSYSNTENAKSQIAFGARVARQGLWREAAFRFEQAIARDPNNARAHNNLAVALEASGEFARALVEYKKALDLAPNDNYVRRNYARFAEFYTSYTRTTGKAAGAP